MAIAVLQLKISIQDSQPFIWRRIQIEQNSSFVDLHEVIQVLMNWSDEKGFFFQLEDMQIADPDDYEASELSNILDAYETELGELLLEQYPTLFYRYFDEDSTWSLKIVTEKVLKKDPSRVYPLCIEGQNAPPPEDCENIEEYMSILPILADPNNINYDAIVSWLGEGFQADYFDREIINDELHSYIEINFPSIEIAQPELFDFYTDHQLITTGQLLPSASPQLYEQQLKWNISQLEQYKEMGEQALNQVTDKALCWKFNEQSNSIAILVQHLSGHMLGHWNNFLQQTEKVAPEHNEFETRIKSRAALMNRWNKGWKCLLEGIERINEQEWQQEIKFNDHPIKVWEFVHQQVAHYAYHIGQIVFLAKILTNQPWRPISNTLDS